MDASRKPNAPSATASGCPVSSAWTAGSPTGWRAFQRSRHPGARWDEPGCCRGLLRLCGSGWACTRWPAFVFHERDLDAVRQTDPGAFEDAQAHGRELTLAEAIAVATEPDRQASKPVQEAADPDQARVAS